MTALLPHRLRLALVAALVAVGGVQGVAAQVTNPGIGRPVRAYVPPDELVSFLPSTPFNEFLSLLNPVFVRVTGKRVVDPMDRTEAIGVALNGVHFIDAFELALDRAGLDFRETEGYFIIEDPDVVPTTADASLNPGAATGDNPAQGLPVAAEEGPATADSREVRIDAVIFEVNNDRVRELGTRVPEFFSTVGSTPNEGELALNATSFFELIDDVVSTGSTQIGISGLLSAFRYFETLNVGRTLATPAVTVQSGEEGRIQSGSDIPIQISDFQGNTITQFVSTGIIIEVTPTVISDSSDGEPVDFIHLDVRVERSAGQATQAGPVIAKNNVDTQVLLLDGEMTALGGLTTTDEVFARSGVPVLRDIPILNFFFSYKRRQLIQRELIVVLQASLVEGVRDRRSRPFRDQLYRANRQRQREAVERFREGTSDELEIPPPDAARDAADSLPSIPGARDRDAEFEQDGDVVGEAEAEEGAEATAEQRRGAY